MPIVQRPLPADLVHHTGTMIRFHKRDFPLLPPSAKTCEVELPDGRVVLGKFGPSRELPYIGGRQVVRWIKSWVAYNSPVHVVAHPVGTRDRVRIEVPGGVRPVPQGELRRLKGRAPRAGLVGQRRRQEFTRWERDPALRELVIGAWGTRCQVSGCRAQDSVQPASVRTKLVDVHHLLSVSSGGLDSPANLVILCSLHHHAMHRATDVKLVDGIGDRVIVRLDGQAIEAVRDVVALLKAMS